jgi:TATA-binding protein-associated factor
MKLDGRQSDCVLVITSYDIARQDHEALAEIPWLYVVVDEAHHIKNPDAKRTRAIKTLNGRHKLALTGTPIQNSLEELWSLFDFVMPGFLGSRSQFRDKFGRTGRIDWDAVHQEKAGLKQRIKPFMLRRLKQTVARDLPKKILVERKVELKPRQVALYKKVIEGAECERLLRDVRKMALAVPR